MKRNHWVIFLLAVFLLLWVFNSAPRAYPFPNSGEEVLSVELIRNLNEGGFGIDERKFEVLRVLDEEAGRHFLDRIQVLPTGRGNQPFWGYGPYFARVTYGNGEIEIFGCSNFELIPKGADSTGFGSYSFRHDDFMKVFSDYCPVDHFNGK